MSLRFSLLCALIVGLAGSATAAWFLRPAWMEEAGLDWWNLASFERQLSEDARLSDELDWKDHIVLNRIDRKEELINDLMAGRATLVETASCFQQLDRAPTEFPCIGPKYYAGRTEGERYCRQILYWVRTRGDLLAPSQTDLLLCRLEAELEEHLAAHDGVVEFPED